VAGAVAAQQPLEQAVKSAYVFRFGEYVAWPDGTFAGPDAPFVIGTLGDDAMAENLEEAVRGRTVGGRPIVVKRLRDAEEARDVHVLYLHPSRGIHRDDVAAALRGRAVLTVGDKSAGSGAIIEFVRQENKVRFEIDAAAAERCGLKLSSKLLSLAVAVTGTP
jgi:hypothetical protein